MDASRDGCYWAGTSNLTTHVPLFVFKLTRPTAVSGAVAAIPLVPL
jgi:hypothetical protein